MKARPLIFDAHLDLAMNAMEWNRDLTRPVAELRASEKGKTDKPDRGNGTVSLPEMRGAGVGLCVATLIARIEHDAYSPAFGWLALSGLIGLSIGDLGYFGSLRRLGP